MRLNPASAFWSILSEESGTSAVEFAIVVPFLILVLLGSTESFRYTWAVRKTVATSNAMGEMISSTQADMKTSDLQFIMDGGMVIAPQVLGDAARRSVLWTSILQPSFTSVVFTMNAGCTSNCTIIANVAWSAGPHRRPCGTLLPVADDVPYSPSSLPQDLFRSGSVIVVDTQMNYQPLFGSAIMPSKIITRSAFFVPRYLSRVGIGDTTSNPSLVTQCPGY